MNGVDGGKRELFVRPAAWVLAAVLSFFAQGAFAQLTGNPLDRLNFRKFWNPVVGKGAVYERVEKESTNKKESVEIQVVGREGIEGKDAYWIEFAIDSPELPGRTYGKSLFVVGDMRPRRTIIQYPGMDAMEMPFHQGSKSKVEDSHARKVGMETITVPAGTFNCEHWKDGNSDYWVSTKVVPFSLVKEVSGGSTRVLVRTIEHATAHITGPVKPFDAKALMQHFAEQRKNQ